MFAVISERLSQTQSNLPRGVGAQKPATQRAGTFQITFDTVTFSFEALEVLEGDAGRRSSFGTQLRAEYAEAKGDRAKLEAYSNRVWDKLAALEGSLSPTQREAIHRHYKSILESYQKNKGGESLHSVSLPRARKIWHRAKGDQCKADRLASGVCARQWQEHEWMAYALALRQHSSGDLRQLCSAYLHSRNRLNARRGLNRLIA